MWGWLTNPERAPAVGVIGLALTLLGFGLTLWQLYVTKKAAQAASEAANSARIRLNAFSALRECEAGKRQLDLIHEAIKTENWLEIISLAQPLSSSLISLARSNTFLDEAVLSAIEEAYRILDKNCETIDRTLSLDATKLSRSKQFSAFRPIDKALTATYFNIERIS